MMIVLVQQSWALLSMLKINICLFFLTSNPNTFHWLGRLGRVSHRVAMSLCLCLPFFVLVLLSASVESVSVCRMRNWFILGFWIFANQSPLHNGKVSREIIFGLMSWAFSVLTGEIFCLFWCWCYYLHTLRVSVLHIWKIFCVWYILFVSLPLENLRGSLRIPSIIHKAKLI